MIAAKLRDYMGTDLTVVNAARVSFAKRHMELDASDEKLIKYLAKHNHWTPFGHCMASFHVKAPIFVARQLVKHQIGLVWNEVSRRYVDGEPEFWKPAELRSRPEGSIKQGSGKDHPRSQDWIDRSCLLLAESIELYNDMIADGVAPEQARAALPLATYTEWLWTGSLIAWARVCQLRLHKNAQPETGKVAQDIANHMAALFPLSWKALMEINE